MPKQIALDEHELFSQESQTLLKLINSSASKLRIRMYWYGLSSSQYADAIKRNLAKVLAKGEYELSAENIDIQKAINQYIQKEPTKIKSLLQEILSFIDLELYNFKTPSIQKKLIKIEGSFNQNSQSIKKELSEKDQPLHYDQFGVVKFEYVKQEDWEYSQIPDVPQSPKAEPEVSEKKRRGRPSGQSKKRNSKKNNP